MDRPFAPWCIRWWLRQLTAALAHVHAQKVIHRDLKAANVFLRDEGGAYPALKLGDFGISRLMSSHTALAQTAVGTPYCNAATVGIRSLAARAMPCTVTRHCASCWPCPVG